MDKRMRTYLESRGLDPKATEDQAWAHLETIQKEDAERAKKLEQKAPETAPAQVPPVAGQGDAADIRSLCGQMSAVGKGELAVKMFGEGRTAAEVRAKCLEELAVERGGAAGPGKKRESEAAELKEMPLKDFSRALAEPVEAFSDAE